LIVRLERGCFKGLDRLQFLALAGNFIRDIPAAVNGGGKEDHFWSDLPNLLTLDLGWNEFRQINRTTFEGISASLERLNLRSNEDLKEVRFTMGKPNKN
jgi:hypothetical protein